jgi:hypothetical protein
MQSFSIAILRSEELGEVRSIGFYTKSVSIIIRKDVRDPEYTRVYQAVNICFNRCT